MHQKQLHVMITSIVRESFQMHQNITFYLQHAIGNPTVPPPDDCLDAKTLKNVTFNPLTTTLKQS